MAEATYGTITILACPERHVRTVKSILARHLDAGYADIDKIELDWDYDCDPGGVLTGFSDLVTSALSRLDGVTAIVTQAPADEWDGESVIIHDGETEVLSTNNVGTIIVPADEISAAIANHGDDLGALVATLRELVGDTHLRAAVEALRVTIPTGTTVPVPPATTPG